MNWAKNTTVALLMVSAAATASAQTISRKSRILAECEFIYFYTAQLMQLQNNSGAAVNILRRATIVGAANMMSNAEDDKVAGWKIKIWTEIRPTLKANLDSKKLDPLAEAGRCDKEAMPIAQNVRKQDLRLWGYHFDGLQQEFMTKARALTGI